MCSHRNKNKNELQDDINVFQNDMWLPQRYSINDKFFILTKCLVPYQVFQKVKL